MTFSNRPVSSNQLSLQRSSSLVYACLLFLFFVFKVITWQVYIPHYQVKLKLERPEWNRLSIKNFRLQYLVGDFKHVFFQVDFKRKRSVCFPNFLFHYSNSAYCCRYFEIIVLFRWDLADRNEFAKWPIILFLYAWPQWNSNY